MILGESNILYLYDFWRVANVWLAEGCDLSHPSVQDMCDR